MRVDSIDGERAEELLLLQAQLVDSTYEPIIAWDLGGVILYWNRAAEELYGYSSEQAVGSVVHQLLRTVHPIPLDDILRQLSSMKLWSGELEYTTGDGQKLIMESHFKLVDVPDRQTLVLQSDRDISIYRQAEAAMRQVYGELEQCVEERTCQLEAANKELESFSYSVSHDLRAPLRSLQGFTRILLMDYAGKVLDDTALDLMQRMTASVTRMGQLIEDLLKLSQVSRTAIHPAPLDMSAMAKSILDDLRVRDPQRKVTIHVQPDVVAVADRGLLHAVMENLLGNAWKFTGKVDAAKIIVGSMIAPGLGTVYFVEDNGAGFDMEFASQLFAPFQRLHDSSEFEGTGVGLATVQRIIHRHAGRIWAVSSPGKGARFCFTLGAAAAAPGRK